jgi:AraC-like DNA-binding protein
MSDFFSFINAILLLGSIQGIILGALLIFSHKKSIMANKILAIILYLISFSILLHVLSHSNILPFRENHQVIISIIFGLLSPLLYLYVKALTEYQFSLRKKHLVHILPFVFSSILGVIFFLSLLDENGQQLLKKLIDLILFVVFITYIIAANLKLYSYGKVIKDNYSNLDKINLTWLRIFIFCMTLLWTLGGIVDVFFRSISWDYMWLLCSIFIFLIGYFGFNQPELFSIPIYNPNEKKEKTIKRYEKSSLTPEMADKYLIKLNKAVKEQKIFLDSDISLSLLSQNLGIPLHYLSQLINEKLGMSFYDYINSNRIEEAKKLLVDPKHNNLTIASIGFEVGFNSLSAFNTAFKKFTKSTPSQYRGQIG